MINSNDRNLWSTECKSTRYNNNSYHHHRTLALNNNTTDTDDDAYTMYHVSLGDVNCFMWSSSDDDDTDYDNDRTQSSSTSSLSDTDENAESSRSHGGDIHSYSESDFFGEAGYENLGAVADTKDVLADASNSASDAEISDFEEDPLCDSGIDLADKFAEILTKFDDILHDVEMKNAVNIGDVSSVSKPCGKVYPFLLEDDVDGDRGDNILKVMKFDAEKVEEKKADVSSDDDDVILVELLRHAWFVLMLYILIKMYFITI